MTVLRMERKRPPSLVTPGRIAGELGVPLHRVLYVLATRQLQPRAFAGRIRLFDKQTVEAVREELRSIDARRAGGVG